MEQGITATRLASAMAHMDIDQSGLARKVGCTPGAINQILTGRTQNSRFLPKIANELMVSTRWLLGQSDEEQDSFALSGEADFASRLELVPIQEINLSYGMGGTYLDDTHVEAETIHFPLKWLRAFTMASPEHLFFSRGEGDSMVPTIFHEDIVLIDRSQANINRQDAIWAIAYGEILMLKRLRSMPDGSYKIMSDNPAVSDQTAVDDEMSVIGRVVATIRRN